MDKPFQRKGSESNAQVGLDFERKAQQYFSIQGLNLKHDVAIEIGIDKHKLHKFDLGNTSEKVIIECKAHKWTEGDNVPSAKLTVWNEAMFFFHIAPSGYRKILFVLRDFSKKRNETLGKYYVRTNSHLIPKDVEVWEYDEKQDTAIKIN